MCVPVCAFMKMSLSFTVSPRSIERRRSKRGAGADGQTTEARDTGSDTSITLAGVTGCDGDRKVIGTAGVGGSMRAMMMMQLWIVEACSDGVGERRPPVETSVRSPILRAAEPENRDQLASGDTLTQSLADVGRGRARE